MIKIKNKTKISTITLILVLTFSSIFVTLLSVSAQTLFTATTEPTGIVNIPFFVEMNSPDDLEFEYVDVKFEVMSPGQTSFIVSSTHTADINGDVDVEYTATQAGHYEFRFNIPAPQGPLSANAESSDGSWTTNTVFTNVVEQYTTDTFAFINAMPNILGVNEQTLLHFGITAPTLWPQRGWEGLTVEVERPDGSSETLGPFITDLTGGAGNIYVPTIVGTYRLRTHFPTQLAQQETMGFPEGTTFLESTSQWFELTVTAEPGPKYPGHPLPTEYWSRPIDAQFREWNIIGGNYLSGGRGSLGFVQPTAENEDFVRNVEENYMAPETGHILWAKPLIDGAFSPLGGGLAGGTGIPGTHAYEDGDAYEGFFTPPVIMGGVIYFNKAKADGGRDVEQYIAAVDIRTGEELWVRNWENRRLDFGQSFFYTGFNYHGTFDYLWETTGSTWNAYEASSGRWVYGMTNVPRGEMLFGPNGEIVSYNIDLEDGVLQKWNSRWVIDGQRWIEQEEPNSRFGSWLREFMGETLEGRVGIEWETDLPVPDSVQGDLQLQRIRDFDGKTYMVFTNFDRGSPAPSEAWMWLVTFDPGHNPHWEPIEWVETNYGRVPRKVHDPQVELVWQTRVELPKDKAILNVEDVRVQDDLIEIIWSENPSVWGYRLSTGEKLWGPVGPLHYQNHWSYESSNSWDLIYDGKVLVGGHGGTIHALDVETGAFIWNFTAPDPFNEYLFNNQWRLRISLITDGKLYIEHSEHSPFDPKPRGAQLYCVDLESGELIWSLNIRGTEWGDRIAIGDNIIVKHNTFDSRVYAIGKGPSETAITIQDDVISLGDQALIKGMVTDISAGTQEYAIKARFPKGVPAVSDSSMSTWMEYVYLQKERPMDVTGVDVRIQIIDPNGEFAWIGTSTTDSSGLYSYVFTPTVEGTYTVISSFVGSESYWGSFAETALSVGSAITPGTPITPEHETPLITTEVAVVLVAAIATIAIIAFLILRRQK